MLVALEDSSSGQAVVILIFIGLITFIWIKSFKLTFSGNTVSYRTLFGATKSIDLVEIKKAYTEVGGRTKKGKFKPMICLSLEPKSSQQEPIYINLKVFGQNELVDFLDVLDSELKKLGNPGLPGKRVQIFGKKGILAETQGQRDKKIRHKNIKQILVVIIIGILIIFIIAFVRGLSKDRDRGVRLRISKVIDIERELK